MLIALLTVVLAAAPPIRVATVARVVADDGRSVSVTQVERAALSSAGWFPELQAELPSAMSGDFDDCVRRCGAKDACVSGCLRAAEVARGLYVVVSLSGSDAVVTAQLIDPARGLSLTDDVQVGPPADLDALVERAVERVLTAAGHTLGGLVRFEIEPADARIIVGAAEPRTLDASRGVALLPGEHRVRLEALDHEPKELTWHVEPRARSTLQARLDPVVTLVERWWFWTAIGVAAAAGVAVGLTASGTFDERRLCHDPRVCP